MDLRGLFWADTLATVDLPSFIKYDGQDRFGREKWRIGGRTTGSLPLEIVCTLDQDELGNLIVLITAYWRRREER
jgi:hypothetical protein